MLESTQIAFTIVIATLIALIYIFYNVFFKKQQSPVSSQENNTESENKQQQQQKQKDKKQNLKPVKTKETLLKHSWLSATLKGKFFF